MEESVGRHQRFVEILLYNVDLLQSASVHVRSHWVSSFGGSGVSPFLESGLDARMQLLRKLSRVACVLAGCCVLIPGALALVCALGFLVLGLWIDLWVG